MTEQIKLHNTDYVWFDGSNIDMKAIYAEESMLELLNEWEEINMPPVGGEKFIKMTELPINIQDEFIELIKSDRI
jgi:hypothetical protein